MTILRDTWLVFNRQALLLTRAPAGLVLGVVQPALYIIFFGPLLRKAIDAGSDADAYRTFIPGLLVMLAIFGPLFCGFTLIAESRAGVLERSRITPVSRFALLLGRSLCEATSLLIQATAVTVVGLLYGVRLGLVPLLLVYLVLALTAVLTSTLSYAAALRFPSEGTLGPVLNGLTQPLLLTSGILLPITVAAPAWLVHVASVNPASWTVNAVRALFAGHPTDPAVWQSVLVLAGLSAVGLLSAARSFARAAR